MQTDLTRVVLEDAMGALVCVVETEDLVGAGGEGMSREGFGGPS